MPGRHGHLSQKADEQLWIAQHRIDRGRLDVRVVVRFSSELGECRIVNVKVGLVVAVETPWRICNWSFGSSNGSSNCSKC